MSTTYNATDIGYCLDTHCHGPAWDFRMGPLTKNTSKGEMYGKMPDGSQVVVAHRTEGNTGFRYLDKDGDYQTVEGRTVGVWFETEDALRFIAAYGGICLRCQEPFAKAQQPHMAT